jgi:tRNA(Ile)-lysidine synthase
MREAGSTTPDPREWAPSPAWPEGRGMFLLRPMLGVRRAEIRSWLTARGERWIDDPANIDPGSARARARNRTAGAAAPHPAESAPLEFAEACEFDAGGGLRLPRAVLRDAPLESVLTFVAIACVCAAGGLRRPATDRLRRVAEILRGPAQLAATLGGARIETEGADVSFLREPGEARRGGMASLYLPPGKAVVWDGRFEITAHRPGLHVDRLEGLARRLPREDQPALRALRPKARLALPVIVDGERFACPALSPVEGLDIRALTAERLWAACGLVEREPVQTRV